MSNQPQRTPLDPNIFDVMSNWLFADPVPGNQKRPNLRIKVLGNVPRITVKTNVDNDKNHGKIDFQTDLATFSAMIAKLIAMAEGTDTSDGYNFDYKDDFLAGKKLDKEIIISTAQIGRDQQTGRLYIAILSGDKSRPRIQFFFGPSRYHDIRRRDGSPLTPRELSEAYAIGFCKPAARLVEQLLITTFNPDARNVAKAPVPDGGGGFNQGGGNRGGGGYNNNQGGGGGYNNNRQQQSSGGFDDSAIADFDEFL